MISFYDKYATKICTITVTCMKYVHFSVNSIFIIIVHVLHAKQFHLIATMIVFRSVSDQKIPAAMHGCRKN